MAHEITSEQAPLSDHHTLETSIAPARRLISADRVQGTPVYSPQGDKLGHIEDVMLGKVSGEVAYAILSTGGFLGAGERYHPLPWQVLKYDSDKGGYVVALTKAELDRSPTLDRAQIDDQSDADWGHSVHTHFGLPAPFI